MNKLHISDAARADIAEIMAYISDELGSPAAARSTAKKITERLRRLKDFPRMGPALSSVAPLAGDYRFLVCGNYLAFYRIIGSDIHVSRVLYGRRDYPQLLFEDADAPSED